MIATANAAINNALKDKGVTEGLALQGLSPLGSTPEDMAKEMRRLYEQWGPIVKRIGFTADS